MFVTCYKFGANTQRHHHKGNLRDGREGKHTLNVALAASHGSCIECGERTYPSYDVECARCIVNPQGEETCYWNTPATTMVAAWIRADTGVGPSMASGNQMCKGNMALLPAPPMNIKNKAVGNIMAP